MDRLVYVAMSGAKETLRAQTTNSYNLANVSTIGFRAFVDRIPLSRCKPMTGSRAKSHLHRLPAGVRGV